MESAPLLKVSVVVPAYNASDTLANCIFALLAQTISRSEYEVIVVDDGSTDNTAEVAAWYDVQLVRQAHRGPAAARNRGLEVAAGGLILLTDADCRPAPNWIEAMSAPFADPDVAGCKGVYRTDQREWVARFVQAEYEEKYRGMARAPAIDFVDTYSAGYRRRILQLEGAFNETIAVAEDAELSFRLARRGYKLVFNPNAVVYHQHARALGHYLRRKFRYGKWRVQVYARYPGKLKGDSHTPGVLFGQLPLVALMLVDLPLIPFSPWSRPLFLLLLTSFLASALPFSVYIWPLDRVVAFIAPFMLWLRALALGLGLAYGLLCFLGARFRKMISREKNAASIP
jgi:cellulose synthase/poly-beta-1,6-N-acetylglucosamine synthase-like glycosyltransferase